MPNLVKTTITLPEDLLRLAKLKAIEEKTNVSALLRRGLINHLQRASDKPVNVVRLMKGFIPTKRHRTDKEYDKAIAQSVVDKFSNTVNP